ncbi:hypothetical protein TGVEG_249890 [Toxoplasma gondii VEG]|uniref:Uncharacterized protein n=1 Tax=Toxoplasma gondii (strain ATCC 50861 / VEG) TaxID=432359 RepID=B9QCV4_TOXGV|nr:hypothetical protein TGVEG_249890 [Toxoplasma gondii VEG]CEL78598.1 TPA: hypothetical protein BN1205_001940 [Toxoplasma gondii VEG]
MATNSRLPPASNLPASLFSQDSNFKTSTSSLGSTSCFVACVVAPDGRVAATYPGGSILLLHRNPHCCTLIPPNASGRYFEQCDVAGGKRGAFFGTRVPSRFLSHCVNDVSLREKIRQLLCVRNTFLASITAPLPHGTRSRRDTKLNLWTGSSAEWPSRSSDLRLLSDRPAAPSGSSPRPLASAFFEDTASSQASSRASNPTRPVGASGEQAFSLKRFSTVIWSSLPAETQRTLCSSLQSSLGALLRATAAVSSLHSPFRDQLSQLLQETRESLRDAERLLSPFWAFGGVTTDPDYGVRVWALDLLAVAESQDNAGVLPNSRDSFTSLDSLSIGHDTSALFSREPCHGNRPLQCSQFAVYLELDVSGQFVFTRWPARFSERRRLVPVTSLIAEAANLDADSLRRRNADLDASLDKAELLEQDVRVGALFSDGFADALGLSSTGELGGAGVKLKREPGLTLAYVYEIQEQMHLLEAASLEAAWLPALRLALSTHIFRQLQAWLGGLEEMLHVIRKETFESVSVCPGVSTFDARKDTASEAWFRGRSQWTPGDRRGGSSKVLGECLGKEREAEEREAFDERAPLSDVETRRRHLRHSAKRGSQLTRLLQLLGGFQTAQKDVTQLFSSICSTRGRETLKKGYSSSHRKEESPLHRVKKTDALPTLSLSQMQSWSVTDLAVEVAPLPSIAPMPSSSSDCGGWSEGPPLPVEVLQRLHLLSSGQIRESSETLSEDTSAPLSPQTSLPSYTATARVTSSVSETERESLAKETGRHSAGSLSSTLSQAWSSHPTDTCKGSEGPAFRLPVCREDCMPRVTERTTLHGSIRPSRMQHSIFGTGSAPAARSPESFFKMPPSLICVIPSVGVIFSGLTDRVLSTRCLCLPFPSASSLSGTRDREQTSDSGSVFSLASELRAIRRWWLPSKACTLSDFNGVLASPPPTFPASSSPAAHASSICWSLSAASSGAERIRTVSLQWLPRDRHQEPLRRLLGAAELLTHAQLVCVHAVDLLGSLVMEGAAALAPGLWDSARNEEAAAAAIAEALPTVARHLRPDTTERRSYASQIWGRDEEGTRDEGVGRGAKGEEGGRWGVRSVGGREEREDVAVATGEEALQLLFEALAEADCPMENVSLGKVEGSERELQGERARAAVENRGDVERERRKAAGAFGACVEVELERWQIPAVGVFSLTKKVLNPGFSSALLSAASRVFARLSGVNSLTWGDSAGEMTSIFGSPASSFEVGDGEEAGNPLECPSWFGGWNWRALGSSPVRSEAKDPLTLAGSSSSPPRKRGETAWLTRSLPQYFCITGTLASSGVCATLHFSTVQQEVREPQKLPAYAHPAPDGGFASRVPLACEKQRAVYGRPPHLRAARGTVLGNVFSDRSLPLMKEDLCAEFADEPSLSARVNQLAQGFSRSSDKTCGADGRSASQGLALRGTSLPSLNPRERPSAHLQGHLDRSEGGDVSRRLSKRQSHVVTGEASCQPESEDVAAKSSQEGPQTSFCRFSFDASDSNTLSLTAVVVTHVSAFRHKTNNGELVRPEALTSPGDVAELLAWACAAAPPARLRGKSEEPAAARLGASRGGMPENLETLGGDRKESCLETAESRKARETFLNSSVTPADAEEVRIAIAAVLDCLECWRQEKDAEAAKELFADLNREVLEQSERIERRLRRHRRHSNAGEKKNQRIEVGREILCDSGVEQERKTFQRL